jgi:hypothetical protein
MRTWRSPFQTREGNRIQWPLSIFKIVIRPELMLISWTHRDLFRTFHTNLTYEPQVESVDEDSDNFLDSSK